MQSIICIIVLAIGHFCPRQIKKVRYMIQNQWREAADKTYYFIVFNHGNIYLLNVICIVIVFAFFHILIKSCFSYLPTISFFFSYILYRSSKCYQKCWFINVAVIFAVCLLLQFINMHSKINYTDSSQ